MSEPTEVHRVTEADLTPQDIIDFWFPDGADPDPQDHVDLWIWRMRGGAHEEVIARFTGITERAAAGDLDHWADTPTGRMALILILDQFTRSVWAGTPRAFASDPKARDLCLEGLRNGHFEALQTAWEKTAFKIPLEHCECADPAEHLANLDIAIAIAEALGDTCPPRLRKLYEGGAEQPRKHREVIARFGRHPHRNAVLGRPSTQAEAAYIAAGVFPHESDLRKTEIQ